MSPKTMFLASALGLSASLTSHAHADVVYTVLNPARNFTLFVYNSPTFIITDTTVSVAQLAFANPLNTITGVDFIPSSSAFPGTSELDVIQSGAPGSSDTTRSRRSRNSVSPRVTATVSASPLRS